MRKPGSSSNTPARRLAPVSRLPVGRRRTDEFGERLVVRLTRKYAKVIDGVDLEDAEVGDELELILRDADILVAEGWAEYVRRSSTRARQPHAIAADHPRRAKTRSR